MGCLSGLAADVAAVAVAAGPHIFVFRSLRPFYKFTLPPLDVAAQARTPFIIHACHPCPFSSLTHTRSHTLSFSLTR